MFYRFYKCTEYESVTYTNMTIKKTDDSAVEFILNPVAESSVKVFTHYLYIKY